MFKKYLYLLFSLLISTNIFAEENNSETLDNLDYPPPVVSLRSLYTGEPMTNEHYGRRSELNLHWNLVDITINNQHFVQFKAYDTEQCFTGGTVTTCGDLARTAWILVPTDTGAFILQSPFDGSCLASFGFGDVQSIQCLRPSQRSQPVPLQFLWAIVPPFGASKLLAQ